MSSFSTKLNNFFEISINAITYSVPGFGHYLHYKQLKKINTLVQGIIDRNGSTTIFQEDKETLTFLESKMNRLKNSERIGSYLKVAMWIFLWFFVFTSTFTFIGVLVDLFILTPYIDNYRREISKKIFEASKEGFIMKIGITKAQAQETSQIENVEIENVEIENMSNVHSSESQLRIDIPFQYKALLFTHSTNQKLGVPVWIKS